ncbi:MAG TPA: BTAD domain-containing putative transcriptional regulator [Baekduia sp.]|uniref:BTAD domain-containing putative transcriptional regulator n=1 Tax=Baekduia sp. TaxID=2600305 RepID=UPI002D788376|nr:BTAD domain-containing putative transcriptional regulator [Baekduia sp.]HET6507955.1 BTAD domain-containing putative transcriptional regulator [Baekduia sp.]
MTVLKAKVRPPAVRGAVVARPRLASRIAELTERTRLVWVRATAGAGKTTAVVEAIAASPRPVAWLTLDASETAPGRLLAHLESALAGAVPGLRAVATTALADDVTHVEAAGLLAEALGERDLTLVVDEVEHLAEARQARAALGAFLRYASPALRVILISRRDVALHMGGARDAGAGHVTEADLAFTTEEAAGAMEALGQRADDAATAVAATGGWVAGVLFEAWRSPAHAHGAGGESDPLSGYLATEIMAALPEAQRRFLVVTSVLDEVTPARAEALGVQDAGALLAGLRSHHVPVAFGADGLEMRCHPRFREFLQQRRLLELDLRTVRDLHRRLGALLVSEQRLDDAVAAFLEGHDVAAAEAVGERAMPGVLRRRDFVVASSWLVAFRPEVVRASRALTYAELIVAMEHEEFTAGTEAADRLLELGAGGPLEPTAAGAIAMCLLHVGRLDDAYETIERLPPGPERDVWRFQLGVAMADDPQHYRDRPDHTGLHGFLARLDLYQGRFDRLLEPMTAPWAAARSSRVEALRAVGRHEEALALLHESATTGWTSSRVRQLGEIMADLGRVAEAEAAAREGRQLLARSGALSAMLHYLFETTLALRLHGDTAAAAAALAKVEADPTARRRLRTLEQIELWHGLMALLDDDAVKAAVHLRRAVALLQHWDRLFFLPAAAVYLAEAEWRLGDEAAADAAADVALAAARRQGSNHLVLQALREFPAVVSRRLDAEAGADSPWHRLGRALMSAGALRDVALLPRVHVREYGTPALLVDDAEVVPKLSKSVELLAYLAAHGRRASRQTLLYELFDGRDDASARSYVRQALTRLKASLPDDAPLEVSAEEVVWRDEHLSGDGLRFERLAESARQLEGAARAEALEAALALVEDGGEYLPGVTSPWVERRRAALAARATDARLDLAETAFALGDLGRADRRVRAVLAADPYRESAWRLAMRVAAALGQDDEVIACFRGCRDALAELTTGPAESTRRLLEHLRR